MLWLDLRGATALELFHGAPLPQLGIPSYDGVRDVYFGDGRQEKAYGGSCTNRGTDLSYGTDLRFQLHLGGEGRRTLLRYDLSMLPAGVKVARAVLMLHVEDLDAKADLACRVVALKRRWSDAMAGIMGGLNETNAANPEPFRPLYPVGRTENWEEPGALGPSDRYPEPIARVTFEKPGWIAIDITSAARHWASGEWPNHGLAIEKERETWAMGRHDVRITASDYPVDPRLRPRLVLALEGAVKPVPCPVREVNADLEAALAKAEEAKKLVLVNVLSAGSLTSRRLEAEVLSLPEVAKHIAASYIEVRLDGDRPEHGERLKAWGVRRFPSAVILNAQGERVGLVEPFDWDAPSGLLRSGFEFPQLYTRALAHALRHPAPAGCGG